MRLPALARKTHKWLALIIAVQAVFWMLSGLYMTAVHINIIHGDHLVRGGACACHQPSSMALSTCAGHADWPLATNTARPRSASSPSSV